MKRKILIDTDPGHDDAMALMLAVASPELDVLAVTTVCGNSTIENVTRNARYVLAALGRSDIPVYSGAARPLRRKLIQAVVHGESGLAGIDPTIDVSLSSDAVERMLALIKANPGTITLVAIGPLTNVAQAIKKDPQTIALLAELIIMGGAIAAPGNKNRVAEFNMFVDPEAAAIVMDFPVKKTLVPLDACNHVQMYMDDVALLHESPAKTMLAAMFGPYIAGLQADEGTSGALMYDVLTIFYLLDPAACLTADYNIQVETTSELTRGMTVADRRKVPDGALPNATVVMDVDSDVVIDTFISALNKANSQESSLFGI
jgi:purine nucleosidase